MKKGDKVTWIHGLGYKCEGVVARDLEYNEFMVPVERRDGTIIRVAYKDLHEEVEVMEMHSQGKWGITFPTSRPPSCRIGAVINYANCTTDEFVALVENKANAQRIVDCVNGCDGINPKAVKDLYEALIHLIGITASLKPNDNIPQADIDTVLLGGKRALAKAEDISTTDQGR